MLEEGKPDTENSQEIAGKKRSNCSQHEGQKLTFFCETCGILICQYCTESDHAKPEHKYNTVESIIEEQRTRIKELVDRSEIIEKQVDEALADAERAHKELKHNTATFEEDLDKEMEMIKKQVEKIFHEKRNWLKKQQEKVATYSEGSIKSSKEMLQDQKNWLKTGRELANKVIDCGSQCDPSVYGKLTSSLETLCEIQPAIIPQDIEKIPTSKLTIIFPTCPSLELLFGQRVSSCSWELEVVFGNKHDLEKLCNARGISKTPEENVVVANYSTSEPVKVFSSTGQFKFNLDQQSNCAWNVAVSLAGNIYVSTRHGQHVFVFKSDGHYLSKFGTKCPEGLTSNVDDVKLRGLAINDDNELLVGEVMKQHISVHDLEGVHLMSFPVHIKPYYITTTSQGCVIVSPGYDLQMRNIEVFDSRGIHQQTIPPPDNVPHQWLPAAMCCSLNDEICISDNGDSKSVHCVSTSGVYLGCITEQVVRPKGLVFLHNDSKLAVVNSGSHDSFVRIFRRK